MTREEITYKKLSELSSKIKERLPRNSGAAANSLEVDGNKLLGNDYIYYLDKGRAPGKFPPVQPIRDWVRNKLGVEDSQVNSVSYLVGRKIANEGTEIFKDNSKGIRLDELVDNMLDELVDELGEVEKIEVLKFL